MNRGHFMGFPKGIVMGFLSSGPEKTHIKSALALKDKVEVFGLQDYYDTIQ